MGQQIFRFCAADIFSRERYWSVLRLDNYRRFIAFFCVCCFVIVNNVAHAGKNWETKSKDSLRLGLDQEVLDVSSLTFKRRRNTNPEFVEELISFRGGWLYFGDVTEPDYSYGSNLHKPLKKVVSGMYKNESMEILSTGKSKNQIGVLEYAFFRPSDSAKTWSCVLMRQYFDCFGDQCGEGSWGDTKLGVALGTSQIRGNYCKSGSRGPIRMQVAERFFDAIYVRPKWTTGLRGKYPRTPRAAKEPTTTTVVPSSSNATGVSSETVTETDSGNTASSLKKKLRELKSLVDEGLITEEEYGKAKKRILDKM